MNDEINTGWEEPGDYQDKYDKTTAQRIEDERETERLKRRLEEQQKREEEWRREREKRQNEGGNPQH